MKQGYHRQRQQAHAEIEASNMQWIRVVVEFFEINRMVNIERKKALRIENFFCNIRRIKVR